MKALRSLLATVSAVGIGMTISIVIAGDSVSAAATVETSIPVNQPFGVAVDETRSRLYVTSRADTQIRAYDSNTLNFLGSRTIASFPTTVEVNEATGNVYVAHQGSGNRISVLDSSLNLLTELPLANPWGPAVNAVTNRFYVANTFGGDVWVVDGATNTVEQTIALPGNSTLGIAVDESKNRVYATDRFSNELYVIDGATNSLVDTLPTGSYPAWVAIDDSLDRVYVSNQNDGTISVFDGQSLQPIGLIPLAVGSRPDKIAINSVTHRAYVSLQGFDTSTTPTTPPRVAIVDTVSNTLVEEVPVPSGVPFQLDVDESTSRVFVPTNTGNTVMVIADPVPVDSDGDGITDDLDSDPSTPSSAFDDGDGTTGEVLSNGTGAPVSIVDLPEPGGVRITTGGTTGQVTVRACGGFTLQIAAASEVDFACGSIVITVGPGGPLVVAVDGEKDVSVEIPSGVSVRISTPAPVTDVFTIEHLTGTQQIVVTEQTFPQDEEAGEPRTTTIPSGQSRSFTTNAPPAIDAVSLSNANAVIGEEVELTVTFSDPGVDDTHTCTVFWAQGVSVPGTVAAGQCTSSYTYSALGLNRVIVMLTDDAGDSEGFGGGAQVLVFDPDTYWTYDPSTTFAANGDGFAGSDVDPVSQDIWLAGNNKIAKFSPDGTLQFEVGGFGTAPGFFDNISDLAVHPSTGDVYVTDIGNNRVQQFDSTGNFVRAFGAGAGTAFARLRGIDVDAAGNVWVADDGSDKVQTFSPSGVYLSTLGGTFAGPLAVGVDPDGKVWVIDFGSSRIEVYKINPATGQRELTVTGFGQARDITFDDVGQAHLVNATQIGTYTLAGDLVALRPIPVVKRGETQYFQPFNPRLTINGEGRLLLTSTSSPVAFFDPPTPSDTDGDGIPDAIECEPDVDGTFCDPDGGGHNGEVITNGTGSPLTFVDLPEPEGVKVIVGGTSGQATIRLCGGFTMVVAAGNEVNVTCGSITIEVVAGGPVTLMPEGASASTTVTVPQGVTVKLSEVVGGQFTLNYIAGDEPVVVEVNGVLTEVDENNGGELVFDTAVPCQPGFYSATGAEPCSPAPAGFFVDSAGATEATPCPVGTFSAVTGAVACISAPAGFFVDSVGATQATPCPVGTFSAVSGAVACTDAPAGSFVDSAGAVAATACPVGETTAGVGSVSVDDCFPIDTDGDGVADVDDVCPGTVLPDAATKGLRKNRFAASLDGFASVDGVVVASLADTGGCSGAQIIAEAGLGAGHTDFGISRSALRSWIDTVNA